MLAGVHIINLLRNATSIGYYWYALVDVTVLLVTAAVLLAGLLRRAGHASDERTMAEAGRFYGRSAMVLLWLVLGALAFDLPIVMYLGAPHGFGDSGPADIAATLFFIVGIYVVCGFRRSDIYFNYSIIDSERYYRGVGRKIGKLALGALALLAVSAVSFCGVCLFGRPTGAQSVAIILTLLFYYIGTTAELAVLYLLYSYLEKRSYDSRTPISTSTMISLGIVIFIYAAYTLHVIFIERTAASAAAVAQGVSILSTLERYIKLALLIFLTYFGYESKNAQKQAPSGGVRHDNLGRGDAPAPWASIARADICLSAGDRGARAVDHKPYILGCKCDNRGRGGCGRPCGLCDDPVCGVGGRISLPRLPFCTRSASASDRDRAVFTHADGYTDRQHLAFGGRDSTALRFCRHCGNGCP